MYLVNAMEISILLEVLNLNNTAQLPDTLPSYRTRSDLLPDTQKCGNNCNIETKHIYLQGV